MTIPSRKKSHEGAQLHIPGADAYIGEIFPGCSGGQREQTRSNHIISARLYPPLWRWSTIGNYFSHNNRWYYELLGNGQIWLDIMTSGTTRSGTNVVKYRLSKGCATNAPKIFVDCARLEVEPIVCRHKPARWDILSGAVFFFLTHHFAVGSLMPEKNI